jgi:hypothetical protein
VQEFKARGAATIQVAPGACAESLFIERIKIKKKITRCNFIYFFYLCYFSKRN